MEVKSNVEWKFWGKRDPLWSVATWPGREKSGSNPWTEEEFYALGERDWADFIRHWNSYGLRNEVVVEIGCGAGRLTKAMARYFSRVVALDVSEDMIDYARQRLDSPTVEFQVVDGKSIPCADGSVTAVFSAQVFQHLESRKDVENYFREIHRVLDTGGSMMIHIPVYEWPPRTSDWVRRFYAIGLRLSDLKALKVRRALERGGSEGLMKMRSYPIRYFFEFLPSLGFRDVEVSIFETRSNGSAHQFILATRA